MTGSERGIATVGVGRLRRALPGLVAVMLAGGCGPPEPEAVQRASVPEGYVLERMADGMDGPRLMTFAPDGALLIGARSNTVWRLEPPYTEPRAYLYIHNYPHDVAVRGDRLLIAQTDGLYRVPYAPGEEPPEPERWLPLPGGPGHISRTVGVGPAGRIHLALGISGNCSDEYLDEAYPFERRRGGILVVDESGGGAGWRTHASGLRNPVGFDWHPGTGRLYATNNGPDHLGYDEPPEYFVEADAGDFFGMPWFQLVDGELQRDPCIDTPAPRPRAEVEHPVATFAPRSAPLGMAFAPPAAGEWAGDAFVAIHGSWATKPRGEGVGPQETRRPPAIVRVHFDQGRPTGEVSTVVSGFQDPETGARWSRPAGIAFGPRGALWFTSDFDDSALYRLRPADPGAGG